MIYLGIDPGLSGAICVFNMTEGSIDIIDMPTVEVTRNAKSKREVSAQLLSSEISNALLKGRAVAFLERVGAMPGQGVTSVFSFGRSVGIVEGVLASFDIPTTIVPPAVWQKAVGVRGGKDGSRERAMQIFPAAAPLFARKKDDGRSDAALIAYYGSSL
jgi:crossover junction endodeoxyribonuclease RuvC